MQYTVHCRTVLTIFVLILQSVITAPMSIGGDCIGSVQSTCDREWRVLILVVAPLRDNIGQVVLTPVPSTSEV